MEHPQHERLDTPSVTAVRPRCAVCNDVIGVYEPLVHVFGGFDWRTSRAAEPSVATAPGTLYHLACHERLGPENPGAGSSQP